MIDKTDQPIESRLRLNLRQLEVFVATARGGSTRGAADRMARSQSAASAALAELEAAIGAPLFDRVGRRLVLNESGRALLPARSRCSTRRPSCRAGRATRSARRCASPPA